MQEQGSQVGLVPQAFQEAEGLLQGSSDQEAGHAEMLLVQQEGGHEMVLRRPLEAQ